MSQIWVALGRSGRVLDGADQGPVEFKQLLPDTSCEDDFRHTSADASTFAEVATKIIEADGFASRELAQTCVDGFERRGIRQYFCGLFECLVLVDRHQRRCGFAIAVEMAHEGIPPVVIQRSPRSGTG